MSKNSKKVIDYLSEDAPVSGQKYALISIVGPHMPQKCDVWGMKVKGVADSLERAKAMSAKLIKSDPEFDIFTVEVGKFFPLAIEPNEVNDIEYQNEQLNLLVKNYLQNRQQANDQWQERKQKMMQEAIREGKNQEELQNKKEHPIAVLQRVHTFEDKIKKLQEELDTLNEDLTLNKEKFDSYTQEEKDQAEDEIKKAISNNESTLPTKVGDGRGTVASVKEVKEDSNDQKIESVRQTELTVSEFKASDVDKTIEELQELDSSISELQTRLNGTNEEHSPNLYKKLSDDLAAMKERKEQLKNILTNKNVINEYINNNYQNSQYEYLEENVKTL